MRWIEASAETESSQIDDMCLKLNELGVDGMVVEDEADFRTFLENNRQYWDYVDEELVERFKGLSRIKFYLADDRDGRALLGGIREKLDGITVSYIEDSDWENNWREHYRPIEVGEGLIIVPEWEDAGDTGRTVLRLDPGLIFGTGSHATTRMCLAELEKYARGRSCLDLGCGSGILGIAALLLGAEKVRGCDIDPKAPDVARSNALLNGIEGDVFEIYAGDITADEGLRRSLGGGYGLVLANIVADVILLIAPIVRSFLAPDGVFICSGIIEGRQDEVLCALEAQGFRILSARCQEQWHCITAT